MILKERVRVSKREIGEFLGVPWSGEDCELARVSAIGDASADALIFAEDEKTFAEALRSAAGLILGPQTKEIEGEEGRVIRVAQPRLAFARVYARWFEEAPLAGVHPNAFVGDRAVIGEGCVVEAGAFVGDGVRLGRECRIGPRVVIHCGTTLGQRVRVQAGTVLGSDGFGYARGAEGYVRFPQMGTLWIGDDVEIGANCTIDRGALGRTSIGRGTKIDNLVHIAHNCTIGEDVMMAAQVGMAGSCVIEDGAMLGGQVGLGERVTIGAGVMLGGQGGVLPGKKLEGKGEVFWGTPARPVREYLRDLARMRRR